MKKNTSRILLQAGGTALGLTLGGRLLPRLIWPHLYGAAYPPLIVDLPAYFFIALPVSFLVTYLLHRWKLFGQNSGD